MSLYKCRICDICREPIEKDNLFGIPKFIIKESGFDTVSCIRFKIEMCPDCFDKMKRGILQQKRNEKEMKDVGK